MNQKEISVVAEKEDDDDEPLLDHFYEVYQSRSAFKHNRRTVVRKNSADSTRKRSGSDSLKQEKHTEINHSVIT